MSLALALASAAVYGAADFVGGVGARRAGAYVVTTWARGAALVALLLATAVVPGTFDGAVLLGAAAGIVSGLALVLFFRALATGPMGVVSPITALLAAGVPTLAGIIAGERPGAASVAGIALGLLAVTIVSRSPEGHEQPLTPKVAAMAVGSGTGFGIFLLVVGTTGSETGLWPLTAGAAAGFALFAGVGVATRRPLQAGTVTGLALLSGSLDAMANVLYLLAARAGLLSISAFLASLYPVTTVLLARHVLGERLHRSQLGGVGLALLAVGLVSLG
jgi:drug/metabolite transporter (DMT)-like permease